MRTIGLAVVGLLAALSSAPAAWAQPMALDAIARDPIRFDRRVVIVRGSVGLTENVGGRPAFQLIDGPRSIRVVAPQYTAVRPGDRVEVEGMFVYAGNQIDALRVTPR